jgi:hypothetical protein
VGREPKVLPTQKGFGGVVLEQVMAEHFDEPPRIAFAASGIRYELSGSREGITALGAVAHWTQGEAE